jgi:hypothetical protein
MTEILVGTIFLVKTLAFTPCVQFVDDLTAKYSHMVIKAEKNDVQVLVAPNNSYRYGFHCTNGQLKIYRKTLTSEE